MVKAELGTRRIYCALFLSIIRLFGSCYLLATSKICMKHGFGNTCRILCCARGVHSGWRSCKMRINRYKWMLLLLLSTVLPVAGVDEWPQWRGPHRDGVLDGSDAPASWPEHLR